MWKRRASVAGRFYPGDPGTLKAWLNAHGIVPQAASAKSPIGVMVPHAGYVYSGKIAAQAYSQIKIPKTAVILCPNHTGRGERISVWAEGEWESPLGPVAVEKEWAAAFLDLVSSAKADREAHLDEHANEVHVPFLQTLNPEVQIVPITLGPLRLEDCLAVGEALAGLSNPETLLVASTDMSHYISAEEAGRLDEMALGAVDEMDASALYETVRENDISMCGFIPTTCVVAACQQRGVETAVRVAYGHSGEVTRDLSSVVAYASALFE